MKEITVTRLARNFREILDQVEFGGEEIALIRNHHQVAQILPGAAHQTALEALSDLHRTLDEDAAKTWVEDSRRPFTRKSRTSHLRNPWDS